MPQKNATYTYNQKEMETFFDKHDTIVICFQGKYDSNRLVKQKGNMAAARTWLFFHFCYCQINGLASESRHKRFGQCDQPASATVAAAVKLGSDHRLMTSDTTGAPRDGIGRDHGPARQTGQLVRTRRRHCPCPNSVGRHRHRRTADGNTNKHCRRTKDAIGTRHKPRPTVASPWSQRHSTDED